MSNTRSQAFDCVWEAIKGWDLQRSPGEGYAYATGTDVDSILDALLAAGFEILAPGELEQVIGVFQDMNGNEVFPQPRTAYVRTTRPDSASLGGDGE